MVDIGSSFNEKIGGVFFDLFACRKKGRESQLIHCLDVSITFQKFLYSFNKSNLRCDVKRSRLVGLKLKKTLVIESLYHTSVPLLFIIHLSSFQHGH